MALVRDAAYSFDERASNVLPLADSSVVFRHSALGLSGGRVRALVSGDTFAGFAGRAADSRSLATGASPEQVPIISQGEALLTVASVTSSNIGAAVYATADDTFSLSTGSYVGRVTRVPSAGSAWVAFDAPNGAAGPLQALVSGAGNTYVRWCIPGRDTSGTLFKDISGRGYDGTIEAGNSGAFAVDARMSTTAGANGGVSVPLAAGDMDFTADSCILAFAMTNEDPAAAEIVASWGASSTTSPGFYLSHRSSAAGVGRVVLQRGNSTLVSGADSTVKFSSSAFNGSATYDPPSLADGAGVTTTVTVAGATLGDAVEATSFSLDLQGITLTAWVSAANTVSVRFQNESGGTLDLASGTLSVRVRSLSGPAERHVVIAFDGPTGSAYLYRDGALAASNVGLMTGSNVFTVARPLFGPRLGANGGGTAVAGVYRGWQGYVFEGKGLPLNISRIAAMLAESPSTPLRDHEFQFA